MATERRSYALSSYSSIHVYADETQVDIPNNRSYISTELWIYGSSFSATNIDCNVAGANGYSTSNFKANGWVKLVSGGFWAGHNSNGTGTATVGSYFTSTYKSMPYGEFTLNLTSIDRGGGSAGASFSSATTNSITLRLSSNVNTSLGSYRLNGGSWTNFSTSGTDLNKTGGGTITKTITGLSPSTSYKIDVEFRRDYNNVWGSIASVTASTLAGTPNVGSAAVSSITDDSAYVTWSGFSFIAGTTWGYYQYRLDKGSTAGSWTKCDTSTSINLTGLSAGTSYKFNVRLVNDKGNISNAASTSFTTLTGIPKDGTVSEYNVTDTVANIIWSGYSFDGGTWGYYQYQVNGGSWVDCATDTYVKLSGLNPSTKYTVKVRLVSNKGKASSGSSVSFTTNAAHPWKDGDVYIKSNNTWLHGRMFIKQNGTWVKSTGNWIKK